MYSEEKVLEFSSLSRLCDGIAVTGCCDPVGSLIQILEGGGGGGGGGGGAREGEEEDAAEEGR
jgi:hypothetical protein